MTDPFEMSEAEFARMRRVGPCDAWGRPLDLTRDRVREAAKRSRRLRLAWAAQNKPALFGMPYCPIDTTEVPD